jgi:hypothetical protein
MTHPPLVHLVPVAGARALASLGRGALLGPPLRLADVTLTPDTGALPGGATLQQLTNGLGGWALVLSLAALVIGAAAWALGSHSQNYQQSFVGRRAVLISGAAALLIGAAPTLINFFFHLGSGLH